MVTEKQYFVSKSVGCLGFWFLRVRMKDRQKWPLDTSVQLKMPTRNVYVCLSVCLSVCLFRELNQFERINKQIIKLKNY